MIKPFPHRNDDFNAGYLLRKKWTKYDFKYGMTAGVIVYAIAHYIAFGTL